jgi:hypothetical protein
MVFFYSQQIPKPRHMTYQLPRMGRPVQTRRQSAPASLRAHCSTEIEAVTVWMRGEKREGLEGELPCFSRRARA